MDVKEQINECDRMYRKVHNSIPADASANICKKLAEMGFRLDMENLPYLCINHCCRWDLTGK